MIGLELKKRLRPYQPRRCKRFSEMLERLNGYSREEVLAGLDKIAREVLLALPAFHTDMRRIVPVRCRRRWVTRQLQLALETQP